MQSLHLSPFSDFINHDYDLLLCLQYSRGDLNGESASHLLFFLAEVYMHGLRYKIYIKLIKITKSYHFFK